MPFLRSPLPPTCLCRPPSHPLWAMLLHLPLTPLPSAPETSKQTDLETPVEAPDEALKNVVPFRPLSEPRAPVVLTPVENSAFNELARQLSARLENENGAPAATPASTAAEPVVAPQTAPETFAKVVEPPNWLTRPEPPGRAGRPGATGCCSIFCPWAS